LSRLSNILANAALAAAVVAASGCAGNVSPAIVPAAVPPAAPASKAPLDRTHGSLALISRLSREISSRQLADGAIVNEGAILGYFGNYSAMALVKAHAYAGAQRWAQWYVAHLNRPGVWGAGCSEYDYTYADGVERSLGTAESIDAHAATFLTLLRVMYLSRNPALMKYVAGARAQAECVATAITSLVQANGLTEVVPGDGNEYLMDNAQAYRGLGDLAMLEWHAWNDAAAAATYKRYQSRIFNGIGNMWMPSLGMYASSTSVRDGLVTPTWTRWYSDSTAQLFLVLNGVLSPNSARAVDLYRAFNAAWPDWTMPGACSSKKLPWAVVAQAASAMGDAVRVADFLRNAESKYRSNFMAGNWSPDESAGLIFAFTSPIFP
jgi:hypothetical protein